MSLPSAHPFLVSVLRGTPANFAPDSLDGRAWDLILRDAAQHGLTPIFFRWLKASGSGPPIPSSVCEQVKDSMFALAARNLALAVELRSILDAFQSERVACAPVRGLALAERLYGDLTARPVGDLDLLVRKEDLPRVAETLRGLGFRPLEHRRGFAEAFSYTLVFLKDGSGWVIVEPHWTIVYPPFVDRLDMRGVWERCVRGRVAGVDTWLLGCEDELLHLCLHLAHPDGTAPLLWFYELDRLLRQEQERVNWARFLSIACQAQLEFVLGEVLRTVQAFFQTPIPDHALDRLRVLPGTSVEGRLLRLLAGTSSVNGREELAVLFTLQGFPLKLRYAMSLLFPAPQFMMRRYGCAGRIRLGLAYFRRFCRLSWEASKGVMKLLF